MKKLSLKFSLLLLMILLLQTSSATTIFELHRIEVDIDERGNTLVKNMFFIDSRNVYSFFLPAFSPKNIYTYDEGGELNYSVSDGIYVDLRDQTEGYSFNVEYFSDMLTSKNASEWTFSYDFYKVGDFDRIEFILTLPINTRLHSFSEDGIIYSEDDYMNIEWEIPNYISSKKMEVKYTFKTSSNGIKKPVNQFLIYATILLLFLMIFLFLKKFKFKSKSRRDFSLGQKDLIHTLTENEKKIIEELLKSRKGLTQKKISLLTGIPKSTLSRILKKLEIRNFIEKRDYGNTKIVKLTEWFLNK